MSAARGLLRSMALIGSAQSVNIAVSILRLKVLALLLGPAGVGLLGIFTSLQQSVSMGAGLGLGLSGVRQIAEAAEDPPHLAAVRRVLLWANVIQGGLAALGVWVWRVPLAVWLLGDDARADQVGLVGVAVLLTLVAASQTALLQGLQRIGALGWVTVIGAVLGTAAGLVAVWLRGADGLIWFVVAQPLASVLAAVWFVSRLPAGPGARLTAARVWAVWRPMATLGIVFMLGSLLSTLTVLAVRGVLAQSEGLEAAGQFSAAWGVTMQYVGFLLGAMAADYYPRLTRAIGDRAAAVALMNDQCQLALALGGPILLLLIGGAPWIVALLYSAEFGPAAELVQWQTVGNVFKLASWPLGFVFVATARSGVFLGVQIFWNAVYLGIFWIGLPVLGLQVTGIGFLVAYALHFLLVMALAMRIERFVWQRQSLMLIAGHGALALGLLALARTAPLAGAVAGLVLALLTGVVGLRVVAAKIGTEGRVGARLARGFAAVGWPLGGAG